MTNPTTDAIAALTAAVRIAEEARKEWDAAPSGMKAGKLLIALAGDLPGYRADIDAIHATRAALLSAQGQAGKPAANEAQVEAAAAAIAWLDYGDEELGTPRWDKTPDDARRWYRQLGAAALNAALALPDSALATIKGLET